MSPSHSSAELLRVIEQHWGYKTLRPLQEQAMHAVLAGRGELEKARDVAARLREFNKPEAEEFFGVCAANPTAFQCGPDPALPYETLLPGKGSAR